MKILYGVAGEGMGHAIRSRVILQFLEENGYSDLNIIASGKAFRYLKKYFSNVHEIWGLSLVIKDNEILIGKTVSNILTGALKGWPSNIKKYLEISKKIKPDLVISDFETWTSLFAIRNNIPLICIDNIQLVTRCSHPNYIFKGEKASLFATHAIIKGKIPRADKYFLTPFYMSNSRDLFNPKKPNTEVLGPVLRPEILKTTETSNKGHILVYQSSNRFHDIQSLLEKYDFEFKVYGLKQGISHPFSCKNVTYYPFSEKTFLKHLKSCHAIIASAGNNLLAESVWLKKPYLAIPIKNQIEQTMNARYLQTFEFGHSTSHLKNKDSIKFFLKKIPFFKKNLNRRDEGVFFQWEKKLLLELEKWI